MNKFGRGVDKLKKGNYQEAKNIFLSIVEKNPKNSRALINLGIAYKNTGQINQAVVVYEKAIRINPKSHAAYNNLANAYMEEGNLEAARKNLLKAVALKSNYAEGYGNLGVYYQTSGNIFLAKRYYKKALRLNPGLFDVLSNYTSVLNSAGDNKNALTLAQKAVEVNPENAAAHNNLANIMRDLGDLDNAKIHYRMSVKLDYRLAAAYPNLLEVLSRLCEWDEAEKVHKTMDEIGGETPFLAIRFHRDLAHHRRTAEAASTSIRNNTLRGKAGLGFWLRRKNEKIKVGYLSANFCRHPVGSVIAPLFALHDRKKFKIFAYSYGVNDKGDIRRKIEKDADIFTDLRNLSDLQAAKKINKDRVDILVDLTGHTEGGRMGILAHAPSPFKISYLGFCGTSGAPFINYMIVDKTLVPPSDAKYYSEKLIYVPDCYQINDSKEEVAKTGFSKKDFGVNESTFVFCSFSRPFKFDRDLFGAWMKILKRTKKSVLVLWFESATTSKNLKRHAKSLGIGPERLIFVGNLEKEKHLERVSVCDLALDPWSYSGGATTADALSVGVPVLTRKGYSYLSRMSESMLKTAKLPELIAGTEADYVSMAVNLAKNGGKLRKLKDKTKKLAPSSKLFDAKLFVRNLEAEYLKIMGATSEMPK